MMETGREIGEIQLEDHSRYTVIVFRGSFVIDSSINGLEELYRRIDEDSLVHPVQFDTNDLTKWDSVFVALIVGIFGRSPNGVAEIDSNGLPCEVDRLVELALYVTEQSGTRKLFSNPGWIEGIKGHIRSPIHSAIPILDTTGATVIGLHRMLKGQFTFRRNDLLSYIQQAGADALPIVAVISTLIGMIFAFVGIMQLAQFGAGIYTADLVAIAMVREIAPIMTAIVLAGRTGAAYAAQLGTMKVGEEIDALRVLGVETNDYLVLPRVVALVLMMPFLSIYSSLFGLIGGAIVSLNMLDVSFYQYIAQTISSLSIISILSGLLKSLVYGALVAISGCESGMACGSSALAVGEATTKSVVRSILLIVVSAAVLTVVYINLGI